MNFTVNVFIIRKLVDSWQLSITLRPTTVTSKLEAPIAPSLVWNKATFSCYLAGCIFVPCIRTFITVVTTAMLKPVKNYSLISEDIVLLLKYLITNARLPPFEKPRPVINITHIADWNSSLYFPVYELKVKLNSI